MITKVLRKANHVLRQRQAPAKLQALGALDIIQSVRDRRLTYLTDMKFVQIAQSIAEIEQAGHSGTFFEAGCALGGSAIVIGTLMGKDREFFVHDVFGMIPPPSDNDPAEVHQRYQTIVDGKAHGLGGGDQYYGYIHDLKTVVRENLDTALDKGTAARVTLVEGLVEDTLVGDAPIAFAHIDVDWYDPVKLCLERIDVRMKKGGIIILDDYFDWQSCKQATNDFLASCKNKYAVDARFGNLRLTKM